MASKLVKRYELDHFDAEVSFWQPSDQEEPVHASFSIWKDSNLSVEDIKEIGEFITESVKDFQNL